MPAANYQRLSKTYAATGNSTVFILKYLQSMYYSVASNTASVIILEKSTDGGNTFTTISTLTNANDTGVIKNESTSQQPIQYRFRCSAYTSGSPVCLMNELPYSTSGKLGKRLQISAAGPGKAGTTAGFVVAVGDNIALVTCPQSVTAGTLVIPVPQIPVGSVIKSFNLVGQIESAGGAVTVDCALRKMTAAAADVTDASVSSMTQLAVTADAIMSAANTEKVLAAPQAVNEDESFYFLITATTAASTDIALQGIVVEFDEP